jgi:hypothetical protein
MTVFCGPESRPGFIVFDDAQFGSYVSRSGGGSAAAVAASALIYTSTNFANPLTIALNR